MLKSVVHEHEPLTLRLADLLCTPTSLGLAAYSDDRFGALVKAIDVGLNRVGVPDNKRYASQDVFFTNLTLLRFKEAQAASLWPALLAVQWGELTIPLTSVALVSSNIAFSPKLVRVHGRHGLGQSAGNL